MSGTKDTEQSLSATNTEEDTDFSAIQRAMLDGNSAELDRLMAVEPKETEEVKAPVEEKTEELTSKPEVPSNEDEKASEEEVKTEAAKSAASPAKPEEEDVETLKRELHRYKSDAGRVAYLQRRQAELERELLVLKTSTSQPTQSNGQPAKVDMSKVEIDPDLQKEIDELKEIDPVLARTMERVAKSAVAAAQAQAASVVTTITQQDQEADDYRFYSEQKARLVEMVPQADAIFATSEWKQWKETLTPNKRAMAESGYADEVFGAIQAFAADMQRQRGVAQAPAQPATPVVTPPEKTEVTDTRERKLATSSDAKSHSAKKTEEFDAEQAFKEMYAKVAKEQHIL